MENKLEIKFKNQKQSFEILEDEIVVDMHTAKHKLKYNIPLEDIKKTHFITKTKQDSFNFLAYFSFIFNILLVFYILTDHSEISPTLIQSVIFSTILAIVFIIKSYIEEYDEKHIDSSKLFYFIYTKNNRIKIDEFIGLVYKKQKLFFKTKYFKVDTVLPYQIQYERYIWLYNNEYITENEFEDIKEDLDKYFNFNPNLNI